MTKEEAIERLENDCCKSRVYCELYPDACQKEECEIYMAIKALERTDTHECVDLISREDAMMKARPEYLNPNQKGHEEYNKAWNDGVEAYWNGLKKLPSEPVGNSDRLKDKWNAHEVANTEEEQPIAWVCSKCGEVVGAQYNFCPNCRADMEGADDEIRSNR